MPPTAHRHAILFFSRDGHTKRLARDLADRLDAARFEIKTDRYGMGIWSYLSAGYDSLKGRLPRIEPVADLSGYDTLSLGSPIWTSYPALPLRAYLAERPKMPATLGIFFTSGGHSPPVKAVAMARELGGRDFAATLSVPNGIEGKPEAETRIAAYSEAIRAAAAARRGA